MPHTPSVDDYLSSLQHPHADAVLLLRSLILDAVPGVTERIKWNAPSFGLGDDDRITMRLQPRDRLQLILHRGAAVKDDASFSFEDPHGLAQWRTRDRGVITLSGRADVEERREVLSDILCRWIHAT